jgi:hypothetical protein
MRRKGAEAEFLLISEAVARLKVGIYGGRPEPKPVASIKANIKKGEGRPSIEWQPQKEDAVKRIYEAIMQGKLSVFVLPVATEAKPHRMPLQVPLGVLTRMIPTRGGLPDYTVEPMRIFANTPIVSELLAALSTSALYLRRKEFEAWYEKARKKRNWPSQRPYQDTPASLRSRSKKNPIGRPSKQSDLQTSIAALVRAGRWSAEYNFIADLARLLGSQGVKASRQTVKRTVNQLHRETGDHRYHRVDPRKQPDESVWGSFEDLAERQRHQHRK